MSRLTRTGISTGKKYGHKIWPKNLNVPCHRMEVFVSTPNYSSDSTQIQLHQWCEVSVLLVTHSVADYVIRIQQYSQSYYRDNSSVCENLYAKEPNVQLNVQLKLHTGSCTINNLILQTLSENHRHTGLVSGENRPLQGSQLGYT